MALEEDMAVQCHCSNNLRHWSWPEEANTELQEQRIRVMNELTMAFMKNAHRELEEQRRRSLKELTVSFLKRTKIHGLHYTFRCGDSKWRRTFWMMAFTAAIVLLFMWSLNRLFYLLSFPAITKVQMTWAKSLYFPAVTICNLNLVRLLQMSKHDLYYSGHWLNVLQQDKSLSRVSTIVIGEKMMNQLLQMSDFQGYFPPSQSKFNTTELFDRVGHQMEDMLLACHFQGKDCTHQNFTTVFTRYGKCYTFNSGKDGSPLLTTLKGGTGNGLELMLDIQQDEYLPVWGETAETSYEAGVKVQIHSQTEPPFVHELGFGVPPGFQTFVSCQEQRLMYLPPPWGDCKSTPMDSDFFTNYSITACRIDCETRYVVANCNCRMVHMPGNAEVCTPEQYKECADPALDFLVEQDNNFCVCDTPCSMTRYGKELSMVKIPSKASAKYLAKKFNKTEQYIAENVLVLDIFFEALNYETIEQKKAYEVAGLLGDIGGQMGLFIGASILTILEILDYLYEVFKDKLLGFFKRKKRPKRSHSDNLSTCDTLRSHSESLGYTPNMLPRHPPVGNFEEFAC
ncbi:acid-sensing ion channel 3 [Protopterus annectens]|uniref:acid-sensing ion channel 3 n=1 Tax=Protopterus annectens TaxID=7888 RepID=UPI001CFA470A|nr:acid-sensing ion channel 3 [Protopterus annectens]